MQPTLAVPPVQGKISSVGILLVLLSKSPRRVFCVDPFVSNFVTVYWALIPGTEVSGNREPG